MDEETRLVIRIMHLAYLVQQLTPYCVFINFASHVNSLQVSIRESKNRWQVEVLTTEFRNSYAQRRKTVEATCAELQARCDVLERILTEQSIPLDDLQYEDEIQRNYYF